MYVFSLALLLCACFVDPLRVGIGLFSPHTKAKMLNHAKLLCASDNVFSGDLKLNDNTSQHKALLLSLLMAIAHMEDRWYIPFPWE